jgi:hypothetical protein
MTDYNTRSLQGRLTSNNRNWDSLTIHEKFDRLDIFYSNNSLYDAAGSVARDDDEWLEVIKPLRNPTHRAIDFFATKLCMGKPKVLVASKSKPVLDAIEQVNKWSGFASNKRAWLRRDALYGNLFIKTTFNGKRIVKTALDTRNVTDFEADERGCLNWIRIDVPMEDGLMFTEYWTKEDGFNGYVATWVHRGDRERKLEHLGDAKTFNYLYEFGIDFIPIVHVKFINTGDKWGKPRTDHAIEKIEEADRKMTNLSEMVFQSDAWLFLRNSTMPDGKLKPAGTITKPTDQEAMRWSRFKVFKAQGYDEAKLSFLDYAWTQFQAIVGADLEELQQDLPELRYYTLRENELSGIAMRTLLAGALDVAREAEEAFITGDTRSNEIALTMGQYYGLFNGLGTFENGDFEHDLQFEEIVPVTTASESATTLQTLMNSLGRENLKLAMKLAGFADEAIDQVVIPEPEPIAETEENTNV